MRWIQGSRRQAKLQNQPNQWDSWRTRNLPLYVSTVLAGMFAVFSLAYWITTYVDRWFIHRPSEYANQMLTLAIAFLLLFATGLTVGRFTWPKQRVFWQSLIDAIRRMAKGDFNIHLDATLVREPGGADHPFRQLVHSINDMAEELGQMEQLRQEFVSNVSHEIQSPLTAIGGFVQALKAEDISPEDRRHYLDIIETESKRLSRLSDNLLKLTSLESGHHPFHVTEYRMDRQVRDAILSMEPLWLEKNIEMEVSLESLMVEADADLLNQVWINLISNAIKFSHPDGSINVSLRTTDVALDTHATVDVAPQSTPRVAIVCISDSGIGMQPEDAKRVFERFFKADKSRNRRVAGSGLGLSIVKKIVDLHQGSVEVESVPGVGSTFAVRLPLHVASEMPRTSGTTEPSTDAAIQGSDTVPLAGV